MSPYDQNFWYALAVVVAIALGAAALADWLAGREVNRMVDEAVAAGVIPEPPDWLFEPDLFAESRPVDIDDCPRCEGQGMVVTIEEGLPGYRLCSWCIGTGMRGAA